MIGSPLQLTIILAIVLVLFGAKKLRNIGGDIGGAIKNFRNSVRSGGDEAKTAEEAKAAEDTATVQQSEGLVIEAEVIKEKDKVS